MAAQAFAGGSSAKLVQASATFEAIGDYAKALGTDVNSVALTPTFGHDLDAMLRSAEGVPSLIYICNPNNPTASITPRADIEGLIKRLPSNTLILIDEAYHHYARPSARYVSFLDRPIDDPRVIVTRTFSAVYGLAGLRIGYGIASQDAAARMRGFATQDNINEIAALAAMAALDNDKALTASIKRNADDRQEFFNQATARMLKPIDSQANFVLMNTFHPANEMIFHFRKHNILIGPEFPALDTCIRISLGAPNDMLAFWQAWDMLPFSKNFMHH
jgi:histidinol-phosphate aminotransferase